MNYEDITEAKAAELSISKNKTIKEYCQHIWREAFKRGFKAGKQAEQKDQNK